MISRLRGLLGAKTTDGVVVDVAGVGYEIAMTPRGIATLPALGEEVVVHTHLHVREDNLALFGFVDDDERDVFRLLIGIPGVGPKLALSITGTLGPDELRRVAAADDIDSLQLVPGVGKRTAQKLVLELKARFEMPDVVGSVRAAGPLAEVRQALENLGYQAAEIRGAVASLSADGEVGELLREALRTLGGAE